MKELLANGYDMRVQSTQSILRLRSDHASIFTKKRFYLCSVFLSVKQRVCFCLRVLQDRVLLWIKPLSTSLAFGTLADLTRGRAELFHLFWKHKSKARARKPKLSPETITLIKEMAANNRRLLSGADPR